MPAFNKVNTLVYDMGREVHNFSSDTLTVALTAAANPPLATNTVLANLTQISYTNLSSRVLTTTSWSQSSGTVRLILADLTLTASGGSVATFRYVAIYNDTASNDELLGWIDYGSNVTLLDTETFTIDFDGTNGLFAI